MIENVLGVARADVYITNILKCRAIDTLTPSPAHVHTCHPYLLKQIELIKPKIVVALGQTAYHYLTGDDSDIANVRGNLYKQDTYTVIPTYHPNYLLRNPSAKKDVFDDLKKIKQLM
jgi:DNA polymerase